MPDSAIQFSRPFVADAEAEALANVVHSGWLVGGPRLAEFEARFAEHCDARHAIGVSSWTTGAFLVLHALGIGPGDEVIVPSYTFIASVNVIAHTGATPIFADIDPCTYNVDPKDIATKITARTRLIMAVDQVGLPCDMDAINALAAKHGIGVLDDAACAFASRNAGRPVGSLCETSVFSLHARKVVTTGEGGMIVTDDTSLAKRLRRLRHQGMSLSDFDRHAMTPTTYEQYPEIGYNFRITDMQAAMGCVQLDKLQTILDRRKSVAQRYIAYLNAHPYLIPPHVPKGLTPNWQSFLVKVDAEAPVERDQVMEALHALGVPTRRSVMASHLEAPYRAKTVCLPNTEYAFASTFQLPIHPGLDDAQVQYVLDALQTVTQNAASKDSLPMV